MYVPAGGLVVPPTADIMVMCRSLVSIDGTEGLLSGVGMGVAVGVGVGDGVGVGCDSPV